jgi:hypothetical protein
MVFNATLTIFQLYRGSQSVLLEETRVPREDHHHVTVITEAKLDKQQVYTNS